jgi:hypothetical protein
MLSEIDSMTLHSESWKNSGHSPVLNVAENLHNSCDRARQLGFGSVKHVKNSILVRKEPIAAIGVESAQQY